MAKKDENKLSYMQMPLPEGRRYSKMTKLSFAGLNKRQTLDTGYLSMEKNISTAEAPYLTPSPRIYTFKQVSQFPISMFGFDDFLICVYTEKDSDFSSTNQGKIKILYKGTYEYTSSLASVMFFPNDETILGTSTQLPEKRYESDNAPNPEFYYFHEDNNTYYKHNGTNWEQINPAQSIVQFNAYYAPTDPISGEYVRKLLIFPDKKSMDFKVTADNFTISDLDVITKSYTATAEAPPSESADHRYYWQNTTDNVIWKWNDTQNTWLKSTPPAIPPIKYATVYMSRLFGVDDNRIYASGFNNYANWNLDTIDGYNESNAWTSPAQSNTKADGAFTGITTYQDHVICFKKDFMHEIYNNKNPFRLQDIYAEGTIDNRTIQDVDGNLIFVSEDNVKMYTGSNPRIIGDNLNMPEFEYAVSGTDNRNYYLYCEDSSGDKYFYVFDTVVGQWSERYGGVKILDFAHNKNGMYMLSGGGFIYKLDTDNYGGGTPETKHNWSFETDLITNKTVDIKHIKKIQMLTDFGQYGGMKVYILYDDETFNESTSHLVYDSGEITVFGKGKAPIRIKPRQTANYGFKLHVEGTGYVKLYELEIFVESGGELYG